MGAFEGDEELGLGDMVDVALDEGLKLLTILPLQHTKTPDIKWLSDIRGMRR